MAFLLLPKHIYNRNKGWPLWQGIGPEIGKLRYLEIRNCGTNSPWGWNTSADIPNNISLIGIKGGLYGKASARQSANYGALRYVIVELNHPEAEMPPWIFLQSTPPVCGVGTYSCPNMSWVGPGVLVRSTCTWKNGHGVTTSRPVPGRWLPWVLYVGSMPTQAMDFRV